MPTWPSPVPATALPGSEYDGPLDSPASARDQLAQLKARVDTLSQALRDVIDYGIPLRVAVAGTDIDITSGSVFTKTISSPTSFTVSSLYTSGRVNNFILELTNGGSAAVIFAFSPKWQGGVQPSFTTSGKDVLNFYSYDNGATWNGFLLGRDVR